LAVRLCNGARDIFFTDHEQFFPFEFDGVAAMLAKQQFVVDPEVD
jgi:hypothetical protein